MSTRSPGPPAEPTVAGRLFYGVTGFFVVPALMAWDGLKLGAHWVWRAPKVVQLILAVIVLGAAVGGTFVVVKWLGWRQRDAINAEWEKFWVAARNADDKELLAILAGVLEMDPNNRDAPG